VQIIKEGWNFCVDRSMCQVLGMDEGIYDMPTCTIIPDLKLEFHVDTNASNFALGAMLSQNPNKTIDRPIYYANRLMNSAKKNYTTTEKEILAMIYVVKKFRHYLLGNNFTFFVDHQALLYLVNKPIVTSQIARWLLLLQKIDFKVIFKPSRVHFLPDHYLELIMEN